MNKKEIIEQLDATSKVFYQFCLSIDDDSFFRQPLEKWSIAQNVKHLIISANTTRLAYLLPKFIIRLYTGKPNRPSRSYEELVMKYKLKLEQGGRASGRFIPEKITKNITKEKWLDDFDKAMKRLVLSIDSKWNEEQLDQYIAPHPLLGKITQRELGYFTIYHTEHHLGIIKDRLRDYSPHG